MTMRVAIITPYFKESLETVKRCHDSVRAQSGDVNHILVADGHPKDEIDTWKNVMHIKLPYAHGDYGDTPRCLGAISAASQGFDAMSFIDADNWIEPDHVKLASELQASSGADIITTTRMLRRLDGSTMGVCNESNGRDFNDTNCYFLTKAAFPSLMVWGMKDKKDAIVGDRVYWANIQKLGYKRAHCMTPTVNYTTGFACHYIAYGEKPPEEAKVIVRFAGQDHSQMVSYTDYLRITGAASR